MLSLFTWLKSLVSSGKPQTTPTRLPVPGTRKPRSDVMSWYTLPPTASLKAGDDGPVFTYIDSGVPPPASEPYTTIIATHGLAYNAHTFSRILALAPKHNLRVVAVNRRCYGGSTAFALEQMSALPAASNEEKAVFVRSTGTDFAAFVDKYIQDNNIPPASLDGKSGGIAFLGWSAGHGVIISALANLEHTPAETQARFKTHVRRFIMQEPPAPILGLPMPPGAWFFEMDESIPLQHRRRMGTIWITSYFDHGDLSTRDPSVLSYIVPSVTRAPSIYSMSPDEFATIVDETVSELEVMAFCGKQSNDNYLKACFDKATRAAVPHLTIHALCGTRGPSFSPAAFWDMQNDDNARGGGHLVYKVIPGANHFMHWDDYEQAIQVYLEALA